MLQRGRKFIARLVRRTFNTKRLTQKEINDIKTAMALHMHRSAQKTDGSSVNRATLDTLMCDPQQFYRACKEMDCTPNDIVAYLEYRDSMWRHNQDSNQGDKKR